MPEYVSQMLEDFYQKSIFLIVPISLDTIREVIYFKWKSTLSKTKHLSMSLLAYKEEGFHCFTWLELLLARSRLFQLAMACSQTFHCLQATKSQNILTCNFTINQLLKRSVRVFIKQDSFFELQSGTIFTTKWGNNYKVVQYRRQIKETKEIDFGNLLLHSPLICLATDTLPLGILEKLKL